MSCNGRPFTGHVHSADASSGVAIPIFENGNSSEYTLASDEYLEVHSYSLTTAAGGDSYINVGAAAANTDEEVVVRGTYAANGGENDQCVPPFVGKLAGTPFVTAPAGVVDATIHGTIRKRGDNTQNKPSWRESDFGQS